MAVLLMTVAFLMLPLFFVLRAGVFGFLAAIAPLFTLIAIYQNEIKAMSASAVEIRGSAIRAPLEIVDLPWVWLAVTSWCLLVLWRLAMWWGVVPGWTSGRR